MYVMIVNVQMVIQLHISLGLMLDGRVFSFTASVSLPTGKNPVFESNRKLGGPKNWFGPLGEENSLPQEETKHDSSFLQPVALSP